MKKKQDKNKKWSFVRDNDAHWYLIPAEDLVDFSLDLEDAEAIDDHENFCNLYDKYRISGHPSSYAFTNPEEL